MKMKSSLSALVLLSALSSINFDTSFGGISSASASSLTCEGKKLTIFGDSLTAGYGLNPGEGFPEQLQTALDAKGYKLNIVNAGVSGDTTTGGLARLDWSLSGGSDAVVIELGANDALRGISPKVTRKNLDTMISSLKERDIDVMLAGMLAPPNMGGSFAKEFNAIFPDLAKKHDVTLYPFFLDGVVADEELNQADGIHPTKQGIAVIVEKILPTTQGFLKQVCEQ